MNFGRLSNVIEFYNILIQIIFVFEFQNILLK